jgi:hypothetical protein
VKERKAVTAATAVAKEQAELVMALQAKDNTQILSSQAVVQAVLLLKGEVFADSRGHVTGASLTSSVMSTVARPLLCHGRIFYKACTDQMRHAARAALDPKG